VTFADDAAATLPRFLASSDQARSVGKAARARRQGLLNDERLHRIEASIVAIDIPRTRSR